MNKKNKNNVDLSSERYGLFMSDESFNLDVMYGRNFLKTDNVQKITLYRINLLETKSHSLYGQAKPQDRSYFPPVELSIVLKIEESKQEQYGSTPGGLVRDDSGNLVFGVYLKELEENNTEINRGDIIEYNMSGTNNRYYEVENANLVTDETNKTIGGFKPYWKKVIAVPAKEDVVGILFKGV